MRIVVPISKALFEKMKNNKNHIDIFYYYDIYPVAEAVSKGKPLTNKDTIKELEKIKAEIGKCRDYIIVSHNNTEADMNRLDGINLVAAIIDERISELKGE